MNILFLTYQGGIAGSTNSIYFLADGLAQKGHNVFVGCRQESLLYELLENSKAKRIAMTFKGHFDKVNIKQIAKLVQKEQIQIINAQSSLDRYTSVFAKWKYKLPVKIFHTRRQTPKSSGGFLQRKFYVSATEKIIVVSEGLKQTFVKKGFPAQHLKVIHNGTPTNRYKKIDSNRTNALQNKYGLNKEDIIIGCVSRHKRQYQLIQALKYLPENIKVMFVGIERSRLENTIELEKPKQQLIFTGTVNRDAVLNYYSLFNLMVLPSITEGFGLVLVEAMAYEVPVIGTAAAGITDVIQDEINGLLFKDDDIKKLAAQILRLVNDSDLRKKCIINGKTTAYETYSIENTIKNYESFFEESLK